MDLKFEEWLDDQRGRKDMIGNLARDVHLKTIDPKPSRHKRDEHKIWADIVIRLNGLENYTTAFNNAWQEFLLAKETIQDLPDKSDT